MFFFTIYRVARWEHAQAPRRSCIPVSASRFEPCYSAITLFYESSLRAGHGWRESLYRHQGCLEASDCGRLGHQAAGHPWSALRVVKSCRKDCPTASVLPKPKQQLCIQNGTRAYYLNYLQERWARRGKEGQASDRQKSDGQTGRTRSMSA